MKESKMHYRQRTDDVPPCGTEGRKTTEVGFVTCRVCWFHILADVAPWARQFLVELRGGAGPRKGYAVRVPGALAEPVDGKVKGLGHETVAFLRKQRIPEKIICERLAEGTAHFTPIQPVVDHGGTPTEAVGVEKGKVAEQPGDAGQISDEAYWNY